MRSQKREEIAKAVSHAFSSGLSSISIAESLITRLRDLEIENLNKQNDFNFFEIDKFIEVLRKTILEMQGSGVPDIILEMSLMNFSFKNILEDMEKNPAAYQKITNVQSNPEVFGDSLDDGKKIFYHIRDFALHGFAMRAMLQSSASFKDYDGKTLTLVFKSKTVADLFLQFHKKEFEEAVYAYSGRNVTVATAVDEEVGDVNVYLLKDEEKKFLEESKKIFQADLSDDNFVT